MEDDDEFGDLYTDVITGFPADVVVGSIPNSTSSLNPNHPPSPSPSPSPSPPTQTQTPTETPTPTTTTATATPTPTGGVGDLNSESRIIPKDPDGDGDDDFNIINHNTSESSSSSDESEDDLQIVLNDTDPLPTNNDDSPLVNLADDPTAADDADWSAAAAAASASDDAPGPPNSDPAKPTNHAHPHAHAPNRSSNFNAYQPTFHSQFKYVRPGAPPLPLPPPPASAGSMPPMPPRPRPDFRPPLPHKGFQPNNYWPPNPPARSLDFTLPSHKTIFDVDIDHFDDKPWKNPGVDVSDFFNFSLNADTWKDYCKQLEQLRLESTMQSKIRVYESGRAEQEYDPDLPPELAAAAAMNDNSGEKADIAKADGGLVDPTKAAACARPLLPTGRAIQVETGNGERIPSVDARAPRLRDSDTVIEIVLQDSFDNESVGNGDTAISDNDSCREDEQVDIVEENYSLGKEKDFDGYPQGRDVMMEGVAKKRSPVSSHADVHDNERKSSSPERASSYQHTEHDSAENIGSPFEDRWTKDTARERSPHMSSGESAGDRRSLDHQREDSSDNTEQRHSPESFSLARVEEATEASVEGKSTADDDFVADHKFGKEKEDCHVIGLTDTSKNQHKLHSTKQQKLRCQVEPSATKDADDEEDLKASRSSDTSKATGNSRDHQKRREGIDEEVVQNGRSKYMGDAKRHHGEVERKSRTKDFDDRTDIDRNYVLAKGRDEYYCPKEWDPYTANNFHVKPEGGDRKRDREHTEASWQRQDEDPHRRRVRPEDSRKHERGDGMVSRHRRKSSEIDRNNKDEYLQPQVVSENVSWKSYHEKDAGLRYREKNDVLKSRHGILDDHHSSRRKDSDYMRRDHVDKLDKSISLRESSSTRGKRDREIFLNERKRDDHPRVTDTYDNHHAGRLKDEVWIQRERAEQQRDRDEWYRAQQSYEENLCRRDREEVRAPVRSSRVIEDKIWAGHSHGREDYKRDKDPGRHGEQLKRRERGEEEISLQHRGSEDVYARGSQIILEGRRPRQEKSAARNDRGVSSSDNQKFHDKKLKDNFKKARESGGYSTAGLSKRQGDKGVANDTADVKGMSEHDGVEHDTSLHNFSREGVSCDGDQQDSKRGRSKLERWTSHKDRDHDVNSRSSSLKMKEMSKNRNASGTSTIVGDEPAKDIEVENSSQCKDTGEGSEVKDVVDAKPRRTDTAEKLKRRRERFKLELESEKDAPAIKKMENESIPSSQNDTPVNTEVKQERPPRKRRWLSS